MGRSTKPTMTYHESYGIVTTAQLRAYRKWNVSPSDHDALVEVLGNDHAAITKAVEDNLGPGGKSFSVFQFWDTHVNYA